MFKRIENFKFSQLNCQITSGKMKMPPTQNSEYAQDTKKCVFLTAGLRKIIGPKNKKT